MSEWGFQPRELHFEGKNYFIAWLSDAEKGGDLKRLRAFAFLEKIELPECDDDLIKSLIRSHQNYTILSFSVQKKLSLNEWDLVKSEAATSSWENFAIIDIGLLNSKKEYLRDLLGPSIELRARRHQFFIKWGFRRPY